MICTSWLKCIAMYWNKLVITLYVFSACYAVEIHFAIHIRYLKTFLLFFNALQIPRCFYSTRMAVIDILNNILFLQCIKISSYCLNVFICLWPSFLLMRLILWLDILPAYSNEKPGVTVPTEITDTPWLLMSSGTGMRIIFPSSRVHDLTSPCS